MTTSQQILIVKMHMENPDVKEAIMIEFGGKEQKKKRVTKDDKFRDFKAF